MKNGKFDCMVDISGYLYDFKLEKRTGNDATKKSYGKTFYTGNVDIAVNEEGTNVVRVNFGYVTPTVETRDGRSFKNRAFDVLDTLANHPDLTWAQHGREGAAKVVVAGANYSVNDYVSKNSGELVSSSRIEGRSMTIVDKLDGLGAMLRAEMLVTAVTRDEEDENNPGKKLYANVKGYVFNWRKEFLPITLKFPAERFPESKYDDEYPKMYNVKGRFVNMNIETSTPMINELDPTDTSMAIPTRTRVNMIELAGMTSIEDGFGEDSAIMTPAAYREGLAAREMLLAEVKSRAAAEAEKPASITESLFGKDFSNTEF